MLKLNTNVIPDWIINGSNTEFKVDKLMAWLSEVRVDGTVDNWVRFEWLKIITSVAPITSISADFFERWVNDVKGSWMVTLWDLVTEFYRTVWSISVLWVVPKNTSRLYPEFEVKNELRKSYKRILNKSPEEGREQVYSWKTIAWYKVIWSNSEDSISLEDSLTNDISWLMMIESWVVYEYYTVSDWVYQVRGEDISNYWERVVIGQKIPFWVKKIISITINEENYKFKPQDEWSVLEDENFFTVVKDFQWNEYILLPYSENSIVYNVNFIPEVDLFSDDLDVIDIPEEYTDVIVLDSAYKLLMRKDDERWITFKNELWDWVRAWRLYEFQRFSKWIVKKPRKKIWFSEL